VALADSRQFSGLVSLATRPLLRIEKIGAPPRNRTAHAEVAARPLATCCGAWHPRGDSNTQWRVWNPLASPLATGVWCAWPDSNRQWTRSERVASAQLGYEPVVFGARFELAIMRPSTARVYQLRHPNIGGQSRIRTSEIPMGYRVYSAALSPTQPTAQTQIVKDLAEDRRLERLCPEGPWLSRPVRYQLPEPSGYKLKIGFKRKLQA
jgi:hypothetical protein